MDRLSLARPAASPRPYRRKPRQTDKQKPGQEPGLSFAAVAKRAKRRLGNLAERLVHAALDRLRRLRRNLLRERIELLALLRQRFELLARMRARARS